MDHSLRRLTARLACAALFGLTGCSSIQQVFGKRPSQNMPAYKPVEVRYVNQNWNTQQRLWFYHTAQGTELVPYEWLLALEQPKFTLFNAAPRFADPAFLARFGFLVDPPSPYNPDGLPVGFAKDTIHDLKTGESRQVVGLTCAACHTGQVELDGVGVRIDGGAASVDLAAFQTELGYAVAFTDKLPFRFDRFAKKVFGENASRDEKDKLRADLRSFILPGLAEKDQAEAGQFYVAGGGFGRTDALGRIGNFVFGTELRAENGVVASGPVKFPPLWQTSWFDRVQYNASIRQPMIRNIGEALGVRARVDLVDADKLYNNTVNVKNLWELEGQLAGAAPFLGLGSPTWPAEVMGKLDAAKVQHGAELYVAHCEKCHLPPVGSPSLQQDEYWEEGLAGKHFLKLKVVPLEVIGTDPNEAENWAKRQVNTGSLVKGPVPATVALRLVTTQVRDRAYDAMGLSAEERVAWNGFRTDEVTAPLAYRARPLAGIWATPPFLHNGSVPNLYELLSPVDQRTKSFYTGSRTFDPVRVGYRMDAFPGAFAFDVTTPGNSNAGHEFSNRPGKGVIGPELSEEERNALTEYLKSL